VAVIVTPSTPATLAAKAATPTIGALVARPENGRWVVGAVGAPHVGEGPEKLVISSFVDRIAELTPQLVTFNGSGFHLLECECC
jgi:predicted PolB exonuclease-like 3'-5' exonuclease